MSVSHILLLIVTAGCFAAGGIFMKLSEGASRAAPTLAFLALFAVGAVLQALALRRSDLGVVYIAVLGLEAVLALAFGVALFHERLSPMRLLAVLLILGGVAMLRGD